MSITPSNHSGRFAVTPSATFALAASGDEIASDIRLDQYYTHEDVAGQLYAVFKQYFNPALYRMIEPSAGTGSFFKLLPAGRLGFDVEPRYPGIQTADFLTVDVDRHRRNAIIGNPPFGKNASMAVRFFNHGAVFSDVIALILPKSFRKFSVQNRLDPAFHLLHEEEVPKHAFLFRGKPFTVPAVFQIWVRCDTKRQPWPMETHHPDFEFTTPDLAGFAIQRVGAQAGRIHHNFAASPSAHYFIKGDVELIMRQLDFAAMAGDVAGNPSLSKAEIIFLYRKMTNFRASTTASAQA